MKGSYKIIWSDEALKGLTDIITYIQNNFSDQDVNKFAVLFDEHINVIQRFPKSFPKSERVSKQPLTKARTRHVPVFRTVALRGSCGLN